MHLISSIFEKLCKKNQSNNMQKWNNFINFLIEKSSKFEECPKNTVIFGILKTDYRDSLNLSLQSNKKNY